MDQKKTSTLTTTIEDAEIPIIPCPQKGHEDQHIIYLDLFERSQKDRLLCSKCVLNHGESSHLVLLADIMKEDLLEVANWPQDEAGSEIKTFLLTYLSKNGEKLIKDLFEKLESEVINLIRKIKHNVITNFRARTETVSQDLINLHLNFDRAYGFDEIREILSDLEMRKLQIQNATPKINQVFKDYTKTQHRLNCSNLIKDLIPKCQLYIDEDRFNRIMNNDILPKFQSILEAFTSSYGAIRWKFTNSGLFQQNNVTQIQKGLTFQCLSQQGESVLVSDQEFSQGFHSFKLKFEEVPEFFQCHVLVGLVDIQKKDFNPYMCVMCSDYMENVIPFNNKAFKIKPGSIVQVVADFQKNSFRIREIFKDEEVEEGAIWQESKNFMRSHQNKIISERLKCLKGKVFQFLGTSFYSKS